MTDTRDMSEAERLAREFHRIYEELAPSYGYETKVDTRNFDPSTPNGQLMISTCQKLIDQRQSQQAQGEVVAYQYRFTDPISGTPLWRFDAGPWNAQNPKASRPLYAAPQPAEQHPDDEAVDAFAAAMKAKLAKKREEGVSGWEDKERCSQGHLSFLLHEHVKKGDPVDVGNFAMMIHQRGENILPAPDHNCDGNEMADALGSCIELIETICPIEGDTIRSARTALANHRRKQEEAER